MLSDARGEWKPSPGALCLYRTAVDATYKGALEAGGSAVMEPAAKFDGHHKRGAKDPARTFWWIATHIEDAAGNSCKDAPRGSWKQRAENRAPGTGRPACVGHMAGGPLASRGERPATRTLNR
jgi:hypothetical protein